MPELDPDHVAVLACQFHEAGCLVADISFADIGKAHRKKHIVQAEQFLMGLHNKGYDLTSKEH